MEKIIDIHTHIYDEQFAEDFDVELKLNKIKFKSYNFLDFFKKFKIEKEIYEKNTDFIFGYFFVKFFI